MITIEVNDEALDRLVEQYGDEVVSQYEDGVPASLYESISEEDPFVTSEELKDAYEALHDGAIRDVVGENDFEEGVEEVESRLEEFEENLRRFTALQYALKEGLDEGAEL